MFVLTSNSAVTAALVHRVQSYLILFYPCVPHKLIVLYTNMITQVSPDSILLLFNGVIV